MATALLIAYLALIVAGLSGAWIWARKMKKMPKSQPARGVAAYLLQELPKGWYVSVQFCVGFAVAGLIAVILFELLHK